MSYLEKYPKGYWNNIENVKKFLSHVAWEEEYDKIEDWYKCSHKKIISYGFGYIHLKKYGGSLCSLLNIVYGNEHTFLPWKFPIVYNNFWDSVENHKWYMDWLFKELKFEKLEDWYKVKKEDFSNNYGGSFLHKYNSLYEIIKTLYPEYNFVPWKFTQVSIGFWDKKENHKWYMDWLFKELGYMNIEDWYKVKREDLNKNYGGTLLNKYNSFYELITNIYTDYTFLPWKFERIYTNFWEKKENHKWYMDWLFKELGYVVMEDWYKIKQDDIYEYYGGTLLNKYSSTYEIIKTLYTEYEFLPWKFIQVSPGFWEKRENHKWYMDWLFKELNFKTMEDLYKIQREDIMNNYGRTLLKYYSSYYELIKNLYPEYEFFPWKFTQTYFGFWDSVENQRWYMDWIFNELNFKTMEDWYKINSFDFVKNYGSTLLSKYYKYSDIFLTLYPDYNWEISKFSYLKGESILNDFLIQKYNVIWGFKTDWCKNPETNCYLPFDFCLENEKIIIELDGTQHFKQVHKWDSPEKTRENDNYKMILANDNGYSVIRLLWEDVYEDKNDWKNKLSEVIKFYEIPKNIFIGDLYKLYY